MLDVLVRGEGPSALVVPMALLAGFAAVMILLSAKLFRWEVS
jgi:ABC-2 type transport system permease protein